MNFVLTWRVNNILYRLTVTRTVANHSIEEFEVRGGEKLIVFRCNRPALKRTSKKQRIKWQIVFKNFPITTNIQTAAQLMLDLQDRLEDFIEPRPTFQEIRTKNINSTGFEE